MLAQATTMPPKNDANRSHHGLPEILDLHKTLRFHFPEIHNRPTNFGATRPHGRTRRGLPNGVGHACCCQHHPVGPGCALKAGPQMRAIQVMVNRLTQFD